MNESKRNTTIIIIVAALGYFVDIYDLILFSVVRITSLKSLGIVETDIMSEGVFLLNMQMAGMLIGGIIWGILGDKKGRLSVLFGSIFLYSVANILNGMITNTFQYSLLRLFAGIGLAGELGAGITLVSEIMPKHTRGYGTMIVASIGILGAVVAALIGDYFPWRIAYFIGGGMGIILLFLRIGVFESSMYSSIKNKNVSKGNILILLKDKRLILKYLHCISIGVPIWFIVGILITFSPEFSKSFGLTDNISTGKAVMFCYIGLALGDIVSGTLSQIFKSRKKIIIIFIVIEFIFIIIYLFFNKFNSFFFYTVCLLLGFSGGYWAVFVTNAAEQFGINIRATVTTTVPNFVRGAVVPATILFQVLSATPIGIVYSALIVGTLTILIAFISARKLEETFGKDLNYLEIS